MLTDATFLFVNSQRYLLHLFYTVYHLISSQLIPLDKRSMSYRHLKYVN